MKKIFSHTSFTAALAAVIDRLAERKVDLSEKHLVVVPDRCTLTAERELCRRFGGAFDVSVVTWSRMFAKNADSAEYLPRKGSVMLVRRVLAEKHGELKCYRRSWETKGFASGLYDVINQFMSCGISPEELCALAESDKERDIALVYEEYLAAAEGKYTDSAGRMRLLAEFLASSDYLKNAHVYVACFDMYTPLMRRVMDAAEKKAKELLVFDVCADNISFGEAELYAAPSGVFAAKAIAARVTSDRRNGIPYSEMCVVTSDAHPEELKRIFRENGIPYCASESLTLAEHPLGIFVTAALNALSHGYRAEDVIRLAKSPFSGGTREERDAFERLVLRRGMTYKAFFSPFAEDAGGEEYLENAENCRRRIASLLKAMNSRAEEGVLAEVECAAEYAFAHYPEDLAAADEGRASPKDKLTELIGLCRRLLGGAPDKTVADALSDGMRETELSARPRLTGAVEIGGERDFRARSFRRIYVADFDSDKHPAVIRDDGLLSDEETERIRGFGAELSPTTAEVNKRAYDEFFLLLDGAEKVMFVYTEKEGNVTDAVRRYARKFVTGGWEKDRAALALSSDPADIIKYCPTENMMEEQYLFARSQIRENDSRPAYYDDIKAVVGEKADRYEMNAPSDTDSSAGALMIGKTTKVSQLESYFKCPRMNYLTYGLRLRKPERGEMNALDVGSALHRVAENYVGIMDSVPPEQAAEKLLAEALAETGKGDIEANKKLVGLLRKEAEGLCVSILSQIKAGSFRPVATEAEFGDGEKYAALPLVTEEKKVFLRGKIDRIDVFGDLVRIIDYKTGNTDVKPAHVRAGLKIQLLLYLAVLVRAGYRPAGAFYFPTRTDFSVTDPYLLVGFCDNSDEVLDAIDPHILADGESVVTKTKGRGKRKYVCGNENAEDLGILMDYAVRAGGKAADEIAEGYIAPSPTENSCKFCDFADCCGYEGGERKLAKAALHPKKENGNA